jgi:prepilin-type N-terminal cleavage/methylation domain-containing protein
MKTALDHFHPLRRGFTLIEIMVVVGIIGLIMAVGVPTLYNMFHKTGFRKSVNDFRDVCVAARQQAILQGVTTTVVFHPHEGRCEVGGSGDGVAGGLAHSATLEDGAQIEGLGINGRDYTDEEVGRIRFYPNGTCDELQLILISEKGDRIGIETEIITGLVNVVPDIREWQIR